MLYLLLINIRIFYFVYRYIYFFEIHNNVYDIIKSGIVDNFFDAYFKHDYNAIKEVMVDDVTWFFMGNHKLAGVKNGINEVVSLFDIMGEIMGKSNPTVEKLVICSKDNYFVECQHIKTNREDGNNIDHHVCVL